MTTNFDLDVRAGVVAYLDLNGVVAVEVVRAICVELGANAVKDFDLIPLYAGFGEKGIGRECRECGAPLGGTEYTKWIMLGTCSDCRC